MPTAAVRAASAACPSSMKNAFREGEIDTRALRIAVRLQRRDGYRWPTLHPYLSVARRLVSQPPDALDARAKGGAS